MKDLTVNLQGSPESPTHVLFIPSLDIVVGSDDPDRFISFVEKYKSHISQKLAQRLVSAKYEVLNRHDGEGEHYLKQLMLESIVTDTGPSGSGAPAHYGAVDISLPDSYTVK
jgi:hypothetical protein